VEDILTPVVMAYELSTGGKIDFYGPRNPDHIMYRIVVHPVVFFIKITPIRIFLVFRRFRVDYVFNNGSFLHTDKRFTLRELPEAFSNAFQSCLYKDIPAFRAEFGLK
jgi:hypothetical protein